MVSLDELIKIDGVAAAGRFSIDGKSTDFKSNMDMPQELVAKSAQYCATVTMMFDTLADAFSKESQMKWTPRQGWTYSGGEWTVVAWGDVAVWCKSEETDMEKLFSVLESSEAEVKPGM